MTTLGNSTTWNFLSRDTTIYDDGGNVILVKISNAHSGWEADSLRSRDSSHYTNGILDENIAESFSRSYDGTLQKSGTRTTYVYSDNLDGGSTIIQTSFSWNDVAKIWKPSYKYVIVFSVHIEAIDQFAEMNSLTSEEMLFFDTSSASFKLVILFSKNSAECTPTTLTFDLNFYSLDTGTSGPTIINHRLVMSFKSTIMTTTNQIRSEQQAKNSLTGNYYTYSKDSLNYDNNGHKLFSERNSYDSTAKVKYANRYQYFTDLYGNDTLFLRCYYDTNAHVWDTITLNRYSRIYDVYGNNLEVVQSSYNNYSQSWNMSNKTVYQYDQINTSILNRLRTVKNPEFSIKTTGKQIIATAQNITSLMLYSVDGRLVSSVNCSQNSTIAMELSQSGKSIASGVYIARIIFGKEQAFTSISIQR